MTTQTQNINFSDAREGHTTWAELDARVVELCADICATQTAVAAGLMLAADADRLVAIGALERLESASELSAADTAVCAIATADTAVLLGSTANIRVRRGKEKIAC
jgi:predicted phage gp36 major capsid-like protein